MNEHKGSGEQGLAPEMPDMTVLSAEDRPEARAGSSRAAVAALEGAMGGASEAAGAALPRPPPEGPALPAMPKTPPEGPLAALVAPEASSVRPLGGRGRPFSHPCGAAEGAEAAAGGTLGLSG